MRAELSRIREGLDAAYGGRAPGRERATLELLEAMVNRIERIEGETGIHLNDDGERL